VSSFWSIERNDAGLPILGTRLNRIVSKLLSVPQQRAVVG